MGVAGRDHQRVRRQLDAAGVPHLLMVDPSCQPPSAVCYELVDGDYVEHARSEDGHLQLDRPFPVRLDLTLPAPPEAS